MEKNIFGNHPVSLSVTESRSPPPAFSSDPLINRENITKSDLVEGYSTTTGAGPSTLSVTDILEIDSPTSAGSFKKASSPVGLTGLYSQLLHLNMKSFIFLFLCFLLPVLFKLGLNFFLFQTIMYIIYFICSINS